jgi:DNA polymerase III sliding clamp (beta) subunit (PCNA family)
VKANSAAVFSDVLQGACKVVAPALGSRLTVHANFRLRTGDAGLTLEARSDDLHIVHLLPPEATEAHLDVLIPGALLQRYLRTVAGGEVRFMHDPNTRRLSISCGEALLRLNVESPDRWPSPPTGTTETYALSATSIGQLRRLSYAAATDASRNVLTGILLDGTFAGASDNTRASSATLGEALPHLILPPELVSCVAKSIGDEAADLEVGASHVAIQTSTTSWGSQQIPGVYPDLRGLVNRPLQEIARVEAARLREVVSRASVFDRDECAHLSAARAAGEITLKVLDDELGDFIETFTAVVDQDAEFAVQLSDLRSALGAVEAEEIGAGLTTSNKHLVLTEPSARQVLPLKSR